MKRRFYVFLHQQRHIIMSIFGEKIPRYFYEKGNIIRLVILTALFALVFINIYKPFSSSNWYNVSDFKFFVFSSLIILTGVLVVVISRIIMYYWGKKHDISTGSYLIWVVAEIFFMSLFYTIYTLYLNPEREYLQVFKESSINTALVLLLPYTGLHLYFSYRFKDKRLKQIEEEHEYTESHTKDNIYLFHDEKNELRLSVKNDNLLYIESADNYVVVWYLHKGKLTKYMLRNTLKALEQNFTDTNVIRCHRSYMVNFDQVKVVRRQKNGIFAEFDYENVPDIPISKTYSEKVNRWFSTYSS